MLKRSSAVKKSHVGFTLVELMITLAIAGIVATVGVPSFMSMIASNRVTAASNELVTALNLAKSEAIRSGQNTVLCKSANGTACGGNWSDGWLLFSDTNANKAVDAGEQIIRAHGAPDPSLQFTFKTFDSIEFAPNGRLNGIGRGARFCFRNSYKDENSRAVVVTQMGRIRTEQRTGSNDDCAPT
jgi:type IV fimbrial biogenesis protein FimT